MILQKERLDRARTLPDMDIIRKVLQGERHLLEILYDRYAKKVYYKCLSITKNNETSQDLAHDIMIKVFLNLSKYKGNSDFSFWVYSITYNHCMDYLKKKKRLRFDDFESNEYEQMSTDDIELENKILKEIQLEQLEVLFKELKGNDKIILLMRYQDSMPVKQIASILNVGESAVKMRLKRGRDRLAELLKEAQNEE